jgi:hypothetical protein
LSHGVNYLPNEYVIKSKFKYVQAILTQGNEVKDLPKIGNHEDTLLPNGETDLRLLEDQQPPIVTNLIVQPIIETSQYQWTFRNRPILKSLKKATIPTLGIKRLTPFTRGSLKLGKPPR